MEEKEEEEEEASLCANEAHFTPSPACQMPSRSLESRDHAQAGIVRPLGNVCEGLRLEGHILLWVFLERRYSVL